MVALLPLVAHEIRRHIWEVSMGSYKTCSCPSTVSLLALALGTEIVDLYKSSRRFLLLILLSPALAVPFCKHDLGRASLLPQG